MVCEAMRQGGQVLCVLEASDTSENTHSKLTSKCAWYKVPLYRLTADGMSLGRSVGKRGPVAAVGITNQDMLRALERYLPSDTAPRAESSQIIN
jgi:ribosomal protein L7Ae-like RNA K-turn-binding protein